MNLLYIYKNVLAKSLKTVAGTAGWSSGQNSVHLLPNAWVQPHKPKNHAVSIHMRENKALITLPLCLQEANENFVLNYCWQF